MTTVDEHLRADQAIRLEFEFADPSDEVTSLDRVARLLRGLDSLILVLSFNGYHRFLASRVDVLQDPAEPSRLESQGVIDEYGWPVHLFTGAEADMHGIWERVRSDTKDRVLLDRVTYNSPLEVIMAVAPEVGGISGFVAGIVLVAQKIPELRERYAQARTTVARKKIEAELFNDLRLRLEVNARMPMPEPGTRGTVLPPVATESAHQHIKEAVDALLELKRLDQSQ